MGQVAGHSVGAAIFPVTDCNRNQYKLWQDEPIVLVFRHFQSYGDKSKKGINCLYVYFDF